MPKLSIITINRNNKEGLRKTIVSVLNQSFLDLEYIIIDGGSNDGSVELINEYADKITYWVSEPDKGIYNAMNKGILQAKGEYLQFLNSGDWLVDETTLSKVFNIQREADIVYGHLNCLYESETIVHKALNENQLSLAYFYDDTLAHPSSFIARRLFNDCLYDESYHIAADKKFFVEQIILRNCTLQQIDEIIVNFNTTGISYNPENHAKLKKENDRIFVQIVPARIAIDYEIFRSSKDSLILAYIPFLNRNKRLEKLIYIIMGSLIGIYKILLQKNESQK